MVAKNQRMAKTTSIQLTGRYEAAFGLLARNILPSLVGVGDFGLEHYSEDQSDFESTVFKYQKEGQEPTELRFGAFSIAQGGGSNGLENIIAPPPLFTFERSKQIIETPINGDNSEVLEVWNTQAYNIRIRGLLIDMKEHQYPEELVTKIHRLFEFNGVVDVTSTQCIDKGIYNLYFKNFSIQGVKGFKDTMQYTLQAKAIKEVGFTLLNPNN